MELAELRRLLADVPECADGRVVSRAELDDWCSRPRTDVDLQAANALPALLAVAEAVARHRTDVWGDDGPVTHEHDAALYASLTRLEEC